MEAKQKADELIEKYRKLEINGIGEIKKAALIAVEEIIKAKPAVLKGYEYELNTKFWQSVKDHLINR